MVRVAHSIFDTADLLDTIKDHFETPPLDTCLFFRSFINDTYRLAAAGRLYYLRIYQAGWRTRTEVEAELDAIERTFELGGAVARPVPLRAGGFVFDLPAPEALRPAVLFHEAPGIDFTYDGANGAANAHRYGRAVAQLHAVTSRLAPPAGRRPLDLQTMLEGPRQIVAARLFDDDSDYFARLCDRLQQRIGDDPNLTLGFCHGDLNSSNIHFDRDRPTVIDFDCCGWGWLSSDIAAFARGVTLGRYPGPAASELIGAFLRGYTAEKSIGTADRDALPACLLMQRIWVSSLHLDGHHRWGNIHYGEQYAARLVRWLRAWDNVLDRRPDWLDVE